MRGLALRNDEVRELMRDGVVVIRRKFKRTPSEDWRPYSYGEVHRMRDGSFVMRNGEPVVVGYGASNADGDEAYICPIGRPGERRFVKEAWAEYIDSQYIEGRAVELGRDTVYRAYGEAQRRHTNWKPSTHMTRDLSRTTTECTHATAEQVDSVWRWAATHKRITE